MTWYHLKNVDYKVLGTRVLHPRVLVLIPAFRILVVQIFSFEQGGTATGAFLRPFPVGGVAVGRNEAVASLRVKPCSRC